MKKRLMNCDNLISKNNKQDDIFHDLINFLDPNSWNIEKVVVPWLSAEEKLRKFSKVLHHEISINEFRDYVENVLQNCSNLAKAEVPSSVQKAKKIISAIAVSSAEAERGFSKMNIIYSDKRSRLTAANLMIINWQWLFCHRRQFALGIYFAVIIHVCLYSQICYYHTSDSVV